MPTATKLHGKPERCGKPCKGVSQLTLFLYYWNACVCTPVHECAHVLLPRCMYGGRRTMCRCLFSPSTMCILDIKLRLADFTVKDLYQWIHLACHSLALEGGQHDSTGVRLCPASSISNRDMMNKLPGDPSFRAHM